MIDTINELERLAEGSIKAEQGDYYGEDGLLVCGKCNTPKQTRIYIFGEERRPMCLCKCEAERLEREDQELKRAEFERRVKQLRLSGFRDSEMEKCTFDNDDKKNAKISEIARNYVDHFKKMKEDGKGLLIYGDVGTGKTFIAACIANALIDKGYPCMVTNFPRLVNTITGMYEGKQQYIDSLNKFALLVIDDLAAERDTEYMSEIIQTIIDSRYRAGLPLIITTNLTSSELQNPADVRKQRIYSRLYDMCIPVKMDGRDRRRQEMRDAVKEYAEMLGL